MRTYSGTTFAVSSVLPSNADWLSFRALPWIDDKCSMQNVPPIGREWGEASEDLVGEDAATSIKSHPKWKPLELKLAVRVGSPTQAALRELEDEREDGAFRFTLPGKLGALFVQGQVAGFNEIDGGSKDDIVSATLKILPSKRPAIERAPVSLAFSGSGALKHRFATRDGGGYFVQYPGQPMQFLPSGAEHTQNVSGAGEALFYTGDKSEFQELRDMNGLWSFDVSALPRTLLNLASDGVSTIAGDLSALPRGMTSIRLSDANTLRGDIANAPRSLTFLLALGANEITGDVADSPPQMTYLYVYGANTLSGDLRNLPAGVDYIRVLGSNTLSLSERTWIDNMRFVLIGGVAKSEAFVDKMLSTLARDATNWIVPRNVSLSADNAPPSAAAQADIDTLTARGVTVVVN